MEEQIEPTMTIKFSNKAETDIYKTKFCEFIQSFPELSMKTEDNIINVFKETSILTKEPEELDELDSVCSKLPSKKARKKKKHQKDPVFFLDTKPSLDEDSIPISIGKVRKLGIEQEEPIKLNFGPKCFNCEGDHSIRDCPMPKDMIKINANKQNHQKNKNLRYHLEDDLKYGHIQAGKISDKLRKALGLGKYEIPGYIYKMRLIGYPPGWFEAAKLTTSELLMYDGDGKSIQSENAKKTIVLDQEKIIQFPGFNAPLESGFKDQFRHHGVPKYSDTQFSKQLEQYIKFLQSQMDDLEMENMDIDETSDAELDDDIKVLDLQESKEIEAISLQELEKQKNNLLEEIKKSQEIISWDQTTEAVDEINTLENEQIPKIKNNTKTVTNDKETIEIVNLNATCTDSENNLSLNNSSTEICVGTPKATVMGTPIFKKPLSPYVKVPPLEHFREGVSQVINFENLPNTEGKYEAMRGVLQLVRKLKQPETKL